MQYLRRILSDNPYPEFSTYVFPPVASYSSSLAPSAGGIGDLPPSPLPPGFTRLTDVQRRSVPAGFGSLGAGTAQNIAVSAPQIAGGALSSIAASSGSLWGMSASVAVPVIGVAVAGITMAITAIFNRKGPKQKVATTQIVNAVAPKFEENLKAYQAGPHTVSSQAQALANFDALWQYIVDNCGQPEMGDPGKRCISERQRGGKFDAFVPYRDPIANDTAVVPDPVLDKNGNVVNVTKDPVTGQTIVSAFTGTGGGSGTLLLMGGLLVAAIALGSGGGK